MPQSTPLNSMTGFAARRGTSAADVADWAWELRAVNGKGLDLRLRVPDWISGLEAALRARLSAAVARGNVTLALRVQAGGTGTVMSVNTSQLDAALDAMAEVEARAMARGLSLAPARPGDILSVRGVLEASETALDSAALKTVLMADFEAVLADFTAMRASEGAALAVLLAGHLDRIEELTFAATTAAEARRGAASDALSASLARVMEGAPGADPDRVAQELALIAVKADVTEEIGRLHAHVAAARTLLESGTPVGRKLDFLAQEFNREASTLCAKAQSGDLTAIGLDLKAVIDQMREQVQNVE